MNDHPLTSNPRCLSEIIAGYLEATACGQAPDRTALLATHLDVADELRAFFADHDKMTQAAAPLRSVLSDAPSPTTETFPQTFGGYELLEEIGRGGMGVVYRARQIRLNRIVALKRIRAGQLASPEDVARFRREAEAAASLDHPHIVPIYEIGEHAGQHYFTMKLIEGGNLNSQLKRFASASGCAPLMIKIARAVHHAHQRGILHRDLKPSNILIDADGQPHVSDFGLAQPIEKEAKLTQSGAIVGTAEFMAPEQARGEKGLTTAVDVYGLGTILYVLLTGRPPFQGDYNWDTLKKVVEEEPILPSSINRQVNRDLEAVCLNCLEKPAAKRYESAEALAAELENWQLGKPISVRTTGPVARGIKWARRRPALAAFAVTAVLLLATVTVGGPVVAIREGILHDAADTALENEKIARKDAEESKNRATQLAEQNGQLFQVAEKKRIDLEILEKREREQRIKLEKSLEELGVERAKVVEQFQQARRNLFTAQMMRISSLTHRDPDRAFALLHDYDACPIDLRDFAWRYHARLCQREIWKSFETTVHMASFSPDGKFIAVARSVVKDPNEKREVCLLDPSSGTVLTTLPFDGARVTSLAFSPDGRILVALTTKINEEAPNLVWWDLPEGKARPVKLALRAIRLASFTPDGKALLLAGLPVEKVARGEQVVQRVDVATGEATVLAKAIRANLGAFSGDGKRLVTTMYRGKFAVLDVETGKQIGSGPPERADLWTGSRVVESDIDAIAISPDGQLLAASNGSGYLAIWDASGKQRFGFKAHFSTAESGTEAIKAITFGPDGATVVTAGSRSVKIWDVRTGELLTTLNTYGSTAVAFSPGAQTLLTAGYPTTLWNLSPEGAFKTLSGFKKAGVRLACSPDGRTLAALDLDLEGTKNQHTIRLYDFATGTERTLPCPTTLDRMSQIHFSSDSKRIMVRGHTWDVASGKIDAAEPKNDAAPAPTYSPVFSPDGKWVARGECKVRRNLLGEATETIDTVEISDQASNKVVGTFEGQSRPLVRYTLGISMRFSNDSKTLAIYAAGNSLADRSLTLLDVPSGKRRAVLEHGARNTPFVFTPDDRYLATAGPSHQGVMLWDVASGKLARFIRETHVPFVFSPDAKNLVALGDDRHTAKLWDIASGQVRAHFVGHRDQITSIKFDPKGRYVATASMDGTVKIWLGIAPSLHAEFKTSFSSESSVSQDGKTLAAFDSFHHRTGITADIQLPDRFHLFDLTTGQPRTTPFERVMGRATAEQEVSAFSPDGNYFVFFDHSHFFQIVDIKAGKVKHAQRRDDRRSGSPMLIRFSPDSATLVILATDYKTLSVWDVVTCTERFTVSHPQGHKPVLAISPDSQWLTVSPTATWNLATGMKRELLDEPRPVGKLLYSPDGRFLLTWGYAPTNQTPMGKLRPIDEKTKPSPMLELWDAATGKHSKLLLKCDNPRKLVFSPDGKTLAVLTDKLHLFDVESGKAFTSPEIGSAELGPFAFRRDGAILALQSKSEGELWAWDVAKGAVAERISLPKFGWLAYTPDGTILACASAEKIMLLDAATYRVRGSLSTGSIAIRSLVFVGNDRLFYSGSNGRLTLLDVRAAIEAHELFGVR